MPPRASGSRRNSTQATSNPTSTPDTSSRPVVQNAQRSSVPMSPSSPMSHRAARPNSIQRASSSSSSFADSMNSPTSSFSSPNNSQPRELPGKIPRPPNAWIIYRGDKLKELAKSQAVEPGVKQADLSKIISLMWRNETEEVKKEYERRAERAKAEHARMYPNYKFAPTKKADKERMRQEAKEAKAKAKEVEREAKKREKNNYFATLGVGGDGCSDLPSFQDPWMRSPPISCANTPEPVHNDLPSLEDGDVPSPGDGQSPMSPITVEDDEASPHLSSAQGKEPVSQPQVYPSLVDNRLHDSLENSHVSPLPAVDQDIAIWAANDALPGSFNDPQAGHGSNSSFDWDVPLDGAPFYGGEPGLLDTFDPLSPYSFSSDTASEEWGKLSPFSSGDQQLAPGSLDQNGLSTNRLHEPSSASLHDVPPQQENRQATLITLEDAIKFMSGGSNAEHFDFDFASGFSNEQAQDELSFSHDSLGNGPAYSPAFSQYPSSTPLHQHEPSTALESLSSVGDLPDIHAPKRRRFSPDSDGEHRSALQSAHEYSTKLEDAQMSRVPRPLMRSGTSEELAHLLSTQMSANNGHTYLDNRPSPAASSLDSPLAQPSTSRKRRYGDC